MEDLNDFSTFKGSLKDFYEKPDKPFFEKLRIVQLLLQESGLKNETVQGITASFIPEVNKLVEKVCEELRNHRCEETWHCLACRNRKSIQARISNPVENQSIPVQESNEGEPTYSCPSKFWRCHSVSRESSDESSIDERSNSSYSDEVDNYSEDGDLSHEADENNYNDSSYNSGTDITLPDRCSLLPDIDTIEFANTDDSSNEEQSNSSKSYSDTIHLEEKAFNTEIYNKFKDLDNCISAKQFEVTSPVVLAYKTKDEKPSFEHFMNKTEAYTRAYELKQGSQMSTEGLTVICVRDRSYPQEQLKKKLVIGPKSTSSQKTPVVSGQLEVPGSYLLDSQQFYVDTGDDGGSVPFNALRKFPGAIFTEGIVNGEMCPMLIASLVLGDTKFPLDLFDVDMSTPNWYAVGGRYYKEFFMVITPEYQVFLRPKHFKLQMLDDGGIKLSNL